MDKISNKDKLVNRTYPAIRACVSNRYKIVTGVFTVYAFIASSLNEHKDIISKDVACFSAWIFVFFIIHNACNYIFNALEQFDLEDEHSERKKNKRKRICDILRVEGFFSIAMLAIVVVGYIYILKPIFPKT